VNCKKGDLAIVIGGRPQELGHVLKVTRRTEFLGVACWYTEPRYLDHDGVLLLFRDAHLRPIGKPGDDATDETLLWKPINRPEEVT
jgi:hypothetical protein